MAEPLINRVYDLKVAGFDDALTKVQTLTLAFKNMDATKKKLNEELQRKLASGDAEAVKLLSEQIKKLQSDLDNLAKTKEASAKEAALLAKAEKDLAAAELLRTKSLIEQEKELDRLIAQEEKKRKADERANLGLKAQADNYYALLQAQKAAIELYRITPSDSPFFEQVKKGAAEAKAKVDAFNRSLSPDGTLVGEYKSGIINAFRDLGLGDFLKQQKNDIENNLQQLIQKNKTLAEEYRKTSAQGGEAFNKIDIELKESIQLQQQMEANLREINTAFKGTGGIGKEITQSLSNEFKNLKTNIAQVAIGYIGFQAVLGGAQSVIRNNAELSDRFVDLKRILGETKIVSDQVVDSLRKIDTRTSLSGLVDISIIAAKAGVGAREIAGVTKALDELQLVAGKELGSIDQTTTSLVKLINIFEGPGKVSEESIRRYGNALVELANKGVASGGFLVGYAQRLAGIEGISKIQINSVLGLAAAFEEQGQSEEVAASATTQILSKIGADVDKFAAIAGKTKEAFQDTLRSNPAEALIQVAQGLKGNATAFDEIAPKFADAEARGVRVQSVFGVLADKADFFRDKIKLAGVALQNTGAITEGATAKQNTFGATLDKISKQFELIGTNRSVQVVLTVVAGALALILTNLVPIITVLGLYGLGWLSVSTTMTTANGVMEVTNGQLLLNRLRLIQLTIQQAVYRIALEAATIFQLAYNTALALYTGIANRATVATTLLGSAARLLPLGLLLTLLGILVASFRAFGSEIDGSTAALRKQALQARINADIAKEAAKATSEQRSEASLMVAIVKDLNISEETRNATLKKLLDLDPAFQKALIDGKLNYQELDKALSAYNGKLLKSAELEAAKSRSGKEFNKLTDLQSVKQEIEIAQKSNKGFGDLSDEAQNAFSKIRTSVGRAAITSSLINASISDADFKTAISDLNKEINKQLQNVDAAQQVFLQKQQAVDQSTPAAAAPAASGPTLSVFERFRKLVRDGGKEEDFKNLKDDIGKQKATLNILSKEYKDLVALEKELENFLNPKNASGRASRLTGEQKDAFKDIDAKRDEQIAAEKLRFGQLQETEETYLRNVLKINTTAADAKLALLKGKNAEERKQIAELKLYKIEQEQDTNKKIFDIQSKAFERNIDDAKKQAEAEFNAVNDDPTKTTLEKLTAKEQFLSKSLALQVLSNTNIDALEKKFGIKSEENEKKRRDAIIAINKELQKTQYDILKESYERQLRLIDEASRRQSNEVRSNAGQRTINVLGDDSLGDKEKARRIKQIEIEETKVLLAQDVANATIALQEKEKALKKGLATEMEVSDAKLKLKLAELAVIKNIHNQEQGFLERFNSSLKDTIANLTNFFKGVKITNEQINEAIDAGAAIIRSTINEAKQAYFDNQRAQIDNEKQNALERLDLQQKQLEDTAESEAEKESIRRQFDEKRKAAEKQAGEEKKQVALKELALNFAVAVVKTLAEYPFPFSLIPVAGLTIQYLLQKSIVNQQQFAEGGVVQPVRVNNGRINTSPNIRSLPNGDNVYATVRTGEVILNEDQQRKLGGARTFAAIGVPGFASGGFTGLGNFPLGDSLQAPVNSGSFLNPGSTANNDKIFAAIDKQTQNLNTLARQTNQRIDNIKVNVVAKEVTDTDNKTKKASARGTL